MTSAVQKISPADLKAQLQEIWNKPGVLAASNGISWILNDDGIHFHSRGGKSYSEYLTPEQKERRKGLAMYNKALKASVMSEAKQTIQDNGLTFYDFRLAPKVNAESDIVPKKTRAKAKPVAQANDKLIKAMNIFWRVPQSELTGFLIRFGIAADMAAQIASMPTLDAVAREFLKVSLAA